MIDKDRWDFCGLCQVPYIKCSYCENTSCNGGGCDKCTEEFAEAINEENWPYFSEEYKASKIKAHKDFWRNLRNLGG